MDGQYQRRHQGFRTEASSGYNERRTEMEILCDNLIVNQWLTEERKKMRSKMDSEHFDSSSCFRVFNHSYQNYRICVFSSECSEHSQNVWCLYRSDSVHVAPLETAGVINVEMIPYCRPMSHGTALPGCDGGLGLGNWPCWLSVSLCSAH